MNVLDKFLAGECGLFDWYLSYQQTDEFEKDLRRYWKRKRDVLLANEEERAAYSREWRKYNKSKIKAIGQRRKARFAALPNTLTDQDWRYALNYFNGCCAVCGRPAGLWHTIAKGHWIPLADDHCPGTIPQNIVPLCNGLDGCNNQQHRTDPTIWLEKRYGSRKSKMIKYRIEAFFSSTMHRNAA